MQSSGLARWLMGKQLAAGVGQVRVLPLRPRRGGSGQRALAVRELAVFVWSVGLWKCLELGAGKATACS